MIDIGDIAPRFSLSDTNNSKVELDDATIAGRFILLLFAHPDAVADVAQYGALAESLSEHGALVYAVMGEAVKGRQIPSELPFPVLVDPDSAIAGAYGLDRLENTVVGSRASARR